MKLRDSLYKPFKHWAEKGAVWVYSDPHFNDYDCSLMDPDWPNPQTQTDLINSKVHKNDTLIILGDVGDPYYIQKLNGYKVLLLGNHDKGATNYMKSYTILHANKAFSFFLDKEDAVEALNYLKAQGIYNLKLIDNNLFDEVYEGPLFIGQKICLSHEPIELDFGLNIHGHNHNGDPFDYFNGAVSANVCANVIKYTPIRLDEILMAHKTDTIHRKTIDNVIARIS